jgi:hypothetical protein
MLWHNLFLYKTFAELRDVASKLIKVCDFYLQHLFGTAKVTKCRKYSSHNIVTSLL